MTLIHVLLCSSLVLLSGCSVFTKAVKDPDVIKEAVELVEEIAKADGE